MVKNFRNHREVIAAFDYFTVPTLSFGVLYCFFVIEHHRRRILHFNATAHPTSERVSQVPAKAQENDHVFEMAPAEECWPFSGHDTPYQITAIRVLQHNAFLG
jgi:hypothetical protein